MSKVGQMSAGAYWGTFAAGFLVIFGIVAFACVYTEIMDIIKCTTFPEMYVFEYVQGIISGG